MKENAANKPGIRFLSFLIVGIICFAAGTRYEAILSAAAPVFGVKVATGSIDLSSVQETYRQLRANYDGKLDTQKLIYGASRGLAEAAGDTHTAYMDPQEASEFDKSMRGDIGGGIGAEIGMRNNQPTVVRPLKDSPAMKAGIKAGEKIVAINGESAAGLTLDQVVAKVRGDIGSSVKLMLADGSRKHEVAVVREAVKAPSVEWSVDGSTGILDINRFADDTGSLARQAAQSFRDQKVSKVILDLRGNPGGAVSSAQAVAGLWLDRRVVLTQRQGDKIIQEDRSTGTPLLADIKTIVLIDNGSASASEIVAGALKDHNEGTLVGEKSYGKGSVQSVIELASGARLKVTSARWYTPKGANIDKTGISPDESVEMTADDINSGRDPQMDRAKSL